MTSQHQTQSSTPADSSNSRARRNAFKQAVVVTGSRKSASHNHFLLQKHTEETDAEDYRDEIHPSHAPALMSNEKQTAVHNKSFLRYEKKEQGNMAQEKNGPPKKFAAWLDLSSSLLASSQMMRLTLLTYHYEIPYIRCTDVSFELSGVSGIVMLAKMIAPGGYL